MMMVLLLIAVSSILGVSYLASVSLQRASSKNLVTVTRARYLAESAVQHAIYACKNTPATLATTSSTSMLGPYTTGDGTSDSYKLYGTPDPVIVGQWTLVGVGVCGSITQTVRATVFRDGGSDFSNKQSMMAGGNITIPAAVRIIGDLTSSGKVTNAGYVDGLITYASTYTSAGGTTTKTPVKVNNQPIPTLAYNNYKTYKIYGKSYNGYQMYNSTLAPGTFANNTVVSSSNPAGIAYYNNLAIMYDNFTFTGTLVVNGDLYIDGTNISITATKGFPALVVMGRIYAVDYSTFTCNGLVYAAQGVVPYIFHTTYSTTKITGGFLSAARGYDATLTGSHQIIYAADKCKIYDPTGTASDASSATVTVTSWND